MMDYFIFAKVFRQHFRTYTIEMFGKIVYDSELMYNYGNYMQFCMFTCLFLSMNHNSGFLDGLILCTGSLH